MRNEIKYSDYTNLPELPADMYWEIKEFARSLRLAIVVSVPQPKKFFGIQYGKRPKLVVHESYYAFLDLEELDYESIKVKAEQIYRDLAETLESIERVKALVGFYPPKKLELP